MLQRVQIHKRSGIIAALIVCSVVWSNCADEGSDNAPPVFVTAPETAVARVGETLQAMFAAEDPDGDAITLSIESGPDAARFAGTGAEDVLSWAPLASDTDPGGRDYVMLVVATDARGGRATHDFVVRVQSADGAPQFTTSNQRILDLARDDTLDTMVEVKDDDSLSVDLTLIDGPEDMVLDQFDSKAARLTWTPRLEQIAEKLLWTATIQADDQSGVVVTQTLSVILIGTEPEGCDGVGEPPTLTHTPLDAQQGAQDYLIEVDVADDKKIADVSLFWTLGDPDDSGSYQSVPMIEQGNGRYATNLPNPVVGAEQPVTVSYLLCASDDDDTSGDTCDHIACIPESGAFQFVASPPEEMPPMCEADLFEPDDTMDDASVVDDGDVLDDLTLCGDSDFFAVDMFAGDRLRVEAIPLGNTMPRVRLSDGETLLEDSVFLQDSTVRRTVFDFGFYFVEVSADQRGAYRLIVDVCENGLDEPNDLPELATSIGDGLILDGLLCPGERDWFVIPVAQAAPIDVEVEVIEPFDGNVDDDVAVTLFAPDGTTVLAEGVSADDTLSLLREVTEPGDYLLAVDSLQDTGDPVSFGMIIIAE